MLRAQNLPLASGCAHMGRDAPAALAFAQLTFPVERENMKRRRARADNAHSAAAAAADDAQADYFLRLLSQICWRTNRRIDLYQRAIAVADARGDAGYACAFRHLTHIDNHDRQILQGVIHRLQRR